jgi:26S proteasome regulatory subunit N7
MEEGEHIEQLPDLNYAQWKFLASQSDEISPNKAELHQKLMEAVKKDNMAPFYVSLCEELKWPQDKQLLEQMNKANEQKLEQLDATIKDAVENLGESEVREAHLAKANFFTRMADKDRAVSQFRLTEEKTIGSGQKLDLVFTQIRLGLFWMDHDIITRNIEKAKAMVEAGSDWDRKNRLKVYEALYLMCTRRFKESATLFLETISTFTAVELLDYDTYIFYTVLMSVVSLDRVTLKDKVLYAPEILQVIDKMPHLGTLMNSLHSCNYAPFFVSLAEVTEQMKRNRFLAPHAGFYCKEMRVKGYTQMLESYRSVQLENMASAFGVTVDFLDREISRFIASSRLHCKIDKVGGIIETNRPDSKNAQYQSTIKQGDALLNRVQKLSRVINL